MSEIRITPPSVVPYVLIGAVVAFFPFASYSLILLEVYMIFQIAKYYGRVDAFEIFLFAAKLEVLSLLLKIVATTLHVVPVVGQFANSAIAAGFIFVLSKIVDSHYNK